MIVVDANALIVLVVGLIDPELLPKHKRTSIYEKEDFVRLLSVIGDFQNIITLPNVWTEVDNLLNNFTGDHRYRYVTEVTTLLKKTSESYSESITACDSYLFFELGLTDSLIIELAKQYEFLITSDSKLSDYAIANGVEVYDLIAVKNERLR